MESRYIKLVRRIIIAITIDEFKYIAEDSYLNEQNKKY